MTLFFWRGVMSRKSLLTILFTLPLVPALAAAVALQLEPAGSLTNLRLAARNSPPRGANATATPADSQPIATFTLHPANAQGGATARATVTLKRPAPSGGASVSLTTADAAHARPPRSLLVPANQTSVTFDIPTSPVKAHATVAVGAALEGAPAVSDTLTLLAPARREWLVAANGAPANKGTPDSPWDLATALAGGPTRSEVKAGDTVWLRGGTYAGAHTSTLQGAPGAPVIVRAARGERVTLDRAGVSEAKQPALKIKGAWVWFWGLEFTNSHPDRSRLSPYAKRDEPWRGSGADVYAPRVKFVNCVFHDNGHGVWDKQDETEIAGCLFYYNGNNKREHALYVGNNSGTKLVADNILFAQGGYGILAHSDSPKSAQKGLRLEGNISFDNGALTLDDQTTGNLQVGGASGVSAERVVLKSNYVYASPGLAASKSNGVRLGFEERNNADVKLLDNYVVARAPLRVWWWRAIECLGNTFYSRGGSIELLPPPRAPADGLAYRWDANTYLGGKDGSMTFADDSATYDFARWRQATGFDAHSRAARGPSSSGEGAAAVFVRPNRYEAGRAHVAVFNWALRDGVAVDLRAVLAPGARYEVRDAQNFYGEAVARGTYDGGPVWLPMSKRQAARPVGNVERTPAHTAPEFGAFVVLQTSDPAPRAVGEVTK